MAITKATASSIAPAAKGDLVAGSATNDAAVLGVGANDTVLTADSSTATGLKWAAPSAAFSGVACTALNDISLSNNTSTVLTWNTESIDTDSYHSTVTNTSRLTIPSGKDGKFLLHASALFATNANGFREFDILKNGSLAFRVFYDGSANANTYMEITRIIDTVATDYYEVRVRQNSGGALSINGTSSVDGSNQFSLVYLGA